MSKNKDFYKILGIEKSASKEEIKKAYKQLAKKYHPDISKEDGAEQKFKDINEAASVLLDDQKRSQYDRYGTTEGFPGGSSQGGFGGGFDPRDFGINLEDIFEQFGFGFSGFGSSSRQNRQSKNTKVYSEVEIDLEDIYFGIEKEIKLNREVKCDDCHGKGAKNTKDIINCGECSGSGVIIEMQRSILGSIRTQKTCPNCQGSGKTIKNPCSTCHGKGGVSKKETIKIKIPKGVESGVTLRVTGKGGYDKESDSYGDLYLKVYIKQDKQFEVDGSDLYMQLNVNFIQAILGDEIEFKHFKKTLSLKIPQGTQSNSVLRLKGKGMPYFNYDSYGDLYVKITVDIPSKTSKEQQKILLDYAKTLEDSNFLKRLKGIFK